MKESQLKKTNSFDQLYLQKIPNMVNCAGKEGAQMTKNNSQKIDLVDDSTCFVCGKENKNGLQLDIHMDEKSGTAWAETVIDEKFCGWTGVVHGGIVSSLLDELMAYAAFTVYKSGVTGELTVRFRKPVPTGKKIRIEGKIDSNKGRIIFTSAKILFENTVMAESIGKMVMIKKAL